MLKHIKTLDLLHPSVHRLLAYPQNIRWEYSGNRRRAACVRTCYQAPGLPHLLVSYSCHNAGRSITAAPASRCLLFPASRSDFLWNCTDGKEVEIRLEWKNTETLETWSKASTTLSRVQQRGTNLYFITRLWMQSFLSRCQIWRKVYSHDVRL